MKLSNEGKNIVSAFIFCSAIGFLAYFYVQRNNEIQVEQDQPKQDTQNPDTVTNDLPLYEYPSGATGSLPFDFETNLPGKRIK